MLQRLVVLKQLIWLHFEDVMNEIDQKSNDLTDPEWSVTRVFWVFQRLYIELHAVILSGEKYSFLSWCLFLLFGLRDVEKQEVPHNLELKENLLTK